jgi:Protein of unknown function (DUF3223)
MSRGQALTIGKKIFETRKAADRFVKDLLYGQPLKVRIQEPHHSFLKALLSMHPRAKEKIGKGINHFSVENSVRGRRCFCLTRIDGTKTDFTFYECVTDRTRARSETPRITTHKPNCWICGRRASIRNSKIDEKGVAVHELCYVAKLALEKEQSQGSETAKVVAPAEQP